MQSDLMKRVSVYMKANQKRKRAGLLLSLLSLVVAGSVFAALSLPAISMSKSQPRLEAERVAAVFGDGMEVRVTAEAPDGDEPSVFVLHTLSNGGGLSDQYEFDEDEACEIETEDGGSIILNRDRQEEGETNYWFTLDPGQETTFLLTCEADRWVAPEPKEPEPTPSIPGGAPVLPSESPVVPELPAETPAPEEPPLTEAPDTEAPDPTDPPADTPVLPGETDAPDGGAGEPDAKPDVSETPEDTARPETPEEKPVDPPAESPADPPAEAERPGPSEKPETPPAAPDPAPSEEGGQSSGDQPSGSEPEESHGGLLASIFLPAYALDGDMAGEVLPDAPSTGDSGEAGGSHEAETPGDDQQDPAAPEAPDTEPEAPSKPPSEPPAAPGEPSAPPSDTEEPADPDGPTEEPETPVDPDVPTEEPGTPPVETLPADTDALETEVPSGGPEEAPGLGGGEPIEPPAIDLDFLAEDGEDQFLVFRGGMAPTYKAALRAARNNDETLELTWKEELEEVTFTAVTDSGVVVTMTGLEDAFPSGDLVLSAEELPDVSPLTEEAHAPEGTQTEAGAAQEAPAQDAAADDTTADGSIPEQDAQTEEAPTEGGSTEEDPTEEAPDESGLPDEDTANSEEAGAAISASTAYEALDRAAEEADMRPLERRVFDLRLLRDSEEVQPRGQVTVSFSNLTEEMPESTQAKVYHIEEDDATDMGARLQQDGTVVMETTHFSLYGVVLAAKEPNDVTLDDLLDGFGITGQFAVFANEMEAQGHMEGTIAVRDLILNDGFIIGTAKNGGSAESSDLTLTIVKEVEGAAPEGVVYRFGIYKADAAETEPPVTTVEISGAGSRSVVLSPGAYRVYELDADGTRLGQGEGSGFTVSYDALNLNGALSGGTGFDVKTSYIDQIVAGTSNTMNIDGGGVLYVGSGNTIVGQTVTPAGGLPVTVQNATSILQPTNIDWEEELDRLASLSERLAACGTDYDRTDLTTPGVRFLNIKVPADGVVSKEQIASAIGDPDQNLNYGIPLGGEQYLVVNLDCSTVNKDTVTLPSVGPNSNNAAGWSEAYCRFIWNMVEDGDCFTGTVTMRNNAAGVILVPRGTADQSATFGGSMLADKVIRSTNEIHQHSFRLNSAIQTTVTNTYAAVGAELKLLKTDAGNEPLPGTQFALYKASVTAEGEWVKAEEEALQTAMAGDDGAVLFSALEPGQYLLYETQAADGYIRPAEPWRVEVTEEGVKLNDADAPEGTGAFPIINFKSGQQTSVSVTKEWLGDGGDHPGTLTVRLLKNGEEIDSVELSDEYGWSHTWSGLTVEEDGVQISYTVEEESVEGYYAAVERTEEIETVSGWQEVHGFTDNGTYLLVPSGGRALAGTVNSSGLTTVPVDVGSATQPAAAAMWSATASRDGFQLTNLGSYRQLGLYGNSIYAVVSNQPGVSSRTFNITADGRLYVLSGNRAYYVYGTPNGGPLNASLSYATPFTLYEWQDGEMLHVTYTITNHKAAVPLPPDQSQLEHNKTIDALRDNSPNPDTTLDESTEDLTDLYRLYLDITGKQEPTDLLLVIDRSGSMFAETIQQNGKTVTRSEAIVNLLMGKNGQKNLIDHFLGLNEENKIAITWFAGDWKKWGDATYSSYLLSGVNDAGVALDWTTSQDKGEINLQNTSGNGAGEIGGRNENGTNYAAGLWQALDTLKGVSGDGHQKVVIFLSDGRPTYYVGIAPLPNGQLTGDLLTNTTLPEPATYQQYLEMNERGPLYRLGTGTDPQSRLSEIQEKVETIAQDFVTTIAGTSGLETTQLYSMAYQTDTTDVLRILSPANGGNPYSVNSGDELASTLQKLLYPVDVTITDHLSQYVEWYGARPDVKVTMKRTGAEEVTTLWAGNEQVGGVIGRATADNETVQDGKSISIVKQVTYSPVTGDAGTTGTVRVEFDDNYTLNPEYTYTLSFNVQTTETAYREFANAGYPVDKDGKTLQGDPGTDYADNDTSSGHDGFHSNQSADVEYTIRGSRYQEPYAHPVIQVGSGGLVIRKTDLTDELKRLPGAEFDLYRRADGENAVSIPGTVDISGVKVNETPLRTNENGEVKVTDLPPAEYYLVETRAPTGYQCLEKPVRFRFTHKDVVLLGTESEQAMASPIAPEETGGSPGLAVKNTDGYDLPSTGGAGTALYTAGGLLLMAAGAILLLKRRSERRGS